MNTPFIFTSGIFVVILFLIGVVYTFKEFGEMDKHPSDFRKDESEEPEIVDKSR